MTAPPAHRRLAALVWICSLALLAPLAWPLCAGRVFVYNDLSEFHLPVRHLYQQALHAGDSVLWTPAIFAGLYLHGEGQAGMFHPLHQILYRLLPLHAAFNLELIASYVAAFAGMCWLLRRLAVGRAASLFGALLFAFSGFTLLHHLHVNMVAVVAHLPGLLAAADVLMVDPRRRARLLAFAGVAAILASELLLGFPQAAWWNLVALAAFVLFRAAEARRWGPLLACAAAVVLGVLLAAVQLLPTADFALHSTRAGVSRSFALMFSLHPYNLVQLWSPYFFARGAYTRDDYMWLHEFGIYSGAILPVALAWAWMRRSALAQHRALILGLTVFAASALVLALGRYGGVAGLLAYVPVLGSLRAPVRYIVLAQFALAILAAIVVDDLLAIADGRSSPPRAPLRWLWLPATLGIATTLLLNTGVLGGGHESFASATSAAPGVAIVVAVTLLIHLSGRRVRWALAALVVLTTLDLAAWGIRFIYRVPPQTLEELTQGIPRAPSVPAAAYAAAPDRGRYMYNVLVLGGYRLTTGYAGLFPASTHPLDGAEALRLSGTRWQFTADGSRLPFDGAVARVRLLDERGHVSTGTALLRIDRPGRLVAHVDAPGRRVLAFTERFHEGWSATADGARLPVVRVEGDFLGCVVDTGTHRVELQFMPRSFVYGAGISIAAGVLLAAFIVVQWMRWR